MGREYTFKYDELLGNEQHQNDGDNQLAKTVKYYRTANQAVYTLNFKRLNGEQHFEEYAFLRRGDLVKMAEKQSIILTYTDDSEVRLEGYNLKALYLHAQDRTLISVSEVDERYLSVDDALISLMELKEPIVTRIEFFDPEKGDD